MDSWSHPAPILNLSVKTAMPRYVLAHSLEYCVWNYKIIYFIVSFMLETES